MKFSKLAAMAVFACLTGLSIAATPAAKPAPAAPEPAIVAPAPPLVAPA